MKKMMILACLIFSVTAITAVAADLASIQSTSDSDMVAQLSNMNNADDWCDYLTTAIENGDDALIMKVISNAQSALNSLDDDTARNVAVAINEKVNDVTVARLLTGKYALAYVGSPDSDGRVVTLKSIIANGDNVGESDLSDGSFLKIGKIGKGGVTIVSEEEEDDPYNPPHPVPPVSKTASRF